MWLSRARTLLDAAIERFRAEDGGFFDTASDAEVLVARPRDPSDNASPSGLSSMLHALVDAHALTGEGRYRSVAEEALATVAALAEKAPRFAGWSLAVAQTMLSGGPLEVAVVGPAGELRSALALRARQHPGAVVIEADGPRDDVPLLAGRYAVDGRPAAYVCRGFVCERPVTTVEELDRGARWLSPEERQRRRCRSRWLSPRIVATVSNTWSETWLGSSPAARGFETLAGARGSTTVSVGPAASPASSSFIRSTQ